MNKKKNGKEKNRKRILIRKWSSALLALLFIFILYVLYGLYGIYTYYTENEEKIKLQEEIRILREQNESLKKEKERLQTPEAVEKVARDDLGLVKPGEVPYVK